LTSAGESGRPLAVFVAGPLHLFRTSGLYYVRELLRNYDVIVVGETSYAGNPIVDSVRQWQGVREIAMLPLYHNKWRYHRVAARLARRIAAMRPALLLQHSDVFPHNLYFERAVPADCRRGTFANGMTLDLEQDFRYIRADKIAEIGRRVHIPPALARVLFFLRTKWNAFVRYTMFPIFFARTTFEPRLDPATGYLRKNAPKPSQFRLMYTERERELHLKDFPTENVVLVRHPLCTVGEEVHAQLNFGMIEPGIALLPTWGFLTDLVSRYGRDEALRVMRTGWRDTLLALRHRLGNLPIRVKLHPAAANDPHSRDLMSDLAREIPGLTVLAPTASAEQLVIRSTCVVGDISSILWWSSMLGDRIVVSLNAWNVTLGDEFSHYPAVVYVRTPAAILDAQLNPAHASSPDLPSVTDYLKACGGR